MEIQKAYLELRGLFLLKAAYAGTDLPEK